MSSGVVMGYTSDKIPSNNKDSLSRAIQSFVKGTWNDFKTTNSVTAGKVTKFGAGVVVGRKVATKFGAVTPLKWALQRFGPLPYEFTKSGAIQVFQLTTVERALLVAKAAAAIFALVTVSYEGGVLVGPI